MTDNVGQPSAIPKNSQADRCKLVVAFIVLVDLAYLLSFSNNPSPEMGRIFVIIIATSLASFALGVPLELIGDYISPLTRGLTFG